MRPTLNAAVTWLREQRAVITDEMIRQVIARATNEVIIELQFPTEEHLAAFGVRCLPESQVDKTVDANGTIYRARFLWRKRVFVIQMLVVPSMGRPAHAVFSGVTRR